MINSECLLPPQVPHVTKLVDALHLTGHAEDLSDTGTGKTYSGAAVARELNVPFLVICPKIVIPAWERILRDFKIKALGVVNYERLTRGNKNSVFTTWAQVPTDRFNIDGSPVMDEQLQFTTKLPPNALIILDEVHECKGLESIKSELLIAATRQGFKRLKVSASAATNITEMKAFGYSARLHNFTNANTFKRHFAVENGAEWTGSFGNITFDPAAPEAREGMKKVHTFLYDKERSASRLTKKDMRAYFKEDHIMATALGMGTNTSKINNVYDRMQYELDKLEERAADYSQHVFAIMMKARRKAELLKCPTYIKRILDHLRDGSSVAVFLNFNESIEAIKERLEKEFKKKTFIADYGKLSIAEIRGGQNSKNPESDKNRQNNIDRFQNDSARVILCNIAAGGVGVSLHDLHGNHPRVSIISPSYSAVRILQALGRIHRADAKTDALQEIVFAAATIEEQACQRVQARLDNLSILNNGDLVSGVQFYNENVRLEDFDAA